MTISQRGKRLGIYTHCGQIGAGGRHTSVPSGESAVVSMRCKAMQKNDEFSRA